MRILCGPGKTIKNNYNLLMALFDMNVGHSMRHSFYSTEWTTEEHFESQRGNRFIFHSAQTGSVAHPTLYSVRTQDVFPELKFLGAF